MYQEVVSVKRPELAAKELVTREQLTRAIDRMGDRVLALAETRTNEIVCGAMARIFKSLPGEIAAAIADANPGMRINTPMLSEALAAICVQRAKN